MPSEKVPPPPRCPTCGAPARPAPEVDRTRTGDRALVFVLPTDPSDAMVAAVVEKLRKWGLQDDVFTAQAVRECLHKALVILGRELDYLWK